MTALRAPRLTRWLAAAPPAVLAIYGGLMAFGAYFAMYAYRKPFTAADYADIGGLAVDYKVALVIAQVVGYALSKFLGVKVISELPASRRAASIVALIAGAELALVGFGLTPAPYNLVFLFLNGLPLGMIWGLVFGFVEGRRLSEVIGAMLCASFIVSSGVVKSVGMWLMQGHGVGEFWMPAATGLLFTPLLLVCVAGLSYLPPPSRADEAARQRRSPMDRAARRALFMRYAPGLVGMIAIYVALTALRDFRDNFAAEIWADLGHGADPAIFSLSELPVAAVVLAALALLAVFRDNRRAFIANLVMVGSGLIACAAVSAGYLLGWIGPMGWMIGLGAGVYLAYTPFNGVLFDRFMAYAGSAGTAGFLIYVADASGYAGSLLMLLAKSLGGVDLDWAPFLAVASAAVGVAGLACLVFAWRYFRGRPPA
ncbi:MAG: hypothetical protein KBC34_06045 [Phenylobacterium sp.]|nr:hypothetical protein [Phenylobacterium sp.]